MIARRRLRGAWLALNACLFLNVWALCAEPGGTPAMLVSFRGGRLILDAGSPSLYDGRPLARQGVVVVGSTTDSGLSASSFTRHSTTLR